MGRGGLYSGFEAYRVLTAEDIKRALQHGVVALDTNVLLNLYRYNEKTVDDLLRVAEAAEERLFVPHQVVREFWRNRQSVIASLGSASRDAQAALAKNSTSTKDAIIRWAKSVALPSEERVNLTEEVDDFYEGLRERVGEEPIRVSAHAPTSEDRLLARLEKLLEDSVGPALSEVDWKTAVEEGERRVENSIPPGYMDVEKLESDLPEGASGDYLVWHQLLLEGGGRGADLVLVTADTKEDWWNRADRGSIIGARHELIDEYLQATGRRFFLLEPADLIKHSSVLGVGTSPESVQDIERVRDESPEHVPWSADAARAVLKELDSQGHTQADVIREAIANGGRIPRARVYELDNRDESQMLRGFTRPVKRVTAELQAKGDVPYGVAALLDAVYETGVKSSHFAVPHEVVELLGPEPT
ncbi:PIN domain-containing protein [Marihabitans asiaticum]|uniref:PIN like domain-containing protein n=1 Tax=Marihabitans asiaticum TaxID=415218 RepID=A0A560WH25_9MICO|nr:PIN domain-containing protein [Marihabitans asiaticum]TWD16972.1 hypothetical protein FB557_0524 [Marihabitans asiaticum]